MWISRVCQCVSAAGLEAAAEEVMQVWTLLRLTHRGGFLRICKTSASSSALSSQTAFSGGSVAGRGGAGGAHQPLTSSLLLKTRYLEM